MTRCTNGILIHRRVHTCEQAPNVIGVVDAHIRLTSLGPPAFQSLAEIYPFNTRRKVGLSQDMSEMDLRASFQEMHQMLLWMFAYNHTNYAMYLNVYLGHDSTTQNTP